jgi:FkbM family methyltransferase
VGISALAVERRLRGLRYGLVVGRINRFRLPNRMWIGRHRVNVMFPNEAGVREAFVEVILSDVYGLDRPRSGACSTVLDIGANVGIFCLAARKVHPAALIHAYEPNSDLEPYLTAQVAATNAQWFREAVGAAEGRGSLQTAIGESVLTRVVSDPSGTVPVVSLSAAVERLGRVDFAKIDCEGSEWALFDDPSPWQLIRELAVEYHQRGALGEDAALARLRELGFTPWRVSPGPAPGYGVILATRAH